MGELSALVACQALPFPDALRLAITRGQMMKQAGTLNPGGMAAIMGLDIAALDKLCAQASSSTEIVQVANDNCPGQVVISGHIPALERALELAQAAGSASFCASGGQHCLPLSPDEPGPGRLYPGC